MTISQFRSLLYTLAKYLGDFTAIRRAITTGSFQPLITRAMRRLYGKLSSRGFNMFK